MTIQEEILAAFSQGPVPPVFAGDRGAYLWAMFGLMILVLLALEWLWRTVWACVENPAPPRHPLTISRAIIICLVATVLIGPAPDLVVLMTWGDVSAVTRYRIAEIDRFLDGLTYLPFSLAWLISYLGEPMLAWQLKRQPLPIDLWPTWQDMKRPAKIGAACFAIAFILAYLR